MKQSARPSCPCLAISVRALMASGMDRVPVPSSGHIFKRVPSVHLNILFSPGIQFIASFLFLHRILFL